VQPSTELSSANSSTNPLLIEQFRYRSNINRSHLVAIASLYKDPEALSRLGFPLENFTRRESLFQMVFVTASDDRYFHIAMDAIANVQTFFPNHSIYFYDLSGGILDIRVNKVITIFSN